MLTINSVSGTKCELLKKDACANGSSRFMVKLGIGWLRHFLCFQAAAHLLFLQGSWEKFQFFFEGTRKRGFELKCQVPSDELLKGNISCTLHFSALSSQLVNRPLEDN